MCVCSLLLAVDSELWNGNEHGYKAGYKVFQRLP